MKATERSRERSQLDTLGSELRSHWQGPRFHHDSYVSASFPWPLRRKHILNQDINNTTVLVFVMGSFFLYPFSLLFGPQKQNTWLRLAKANQNQTRETCGLFGEAMFAPVEPTAKRQWDWMWILTWKVFNLVGQCGSPEVTRTSPCLLCLVTLSGLAV